MKPKQKKLEEVKYKIHKLQALEAPGLFEEIIKELPVEPKWSQADFVIEGVFPPKTRYLNISRQEYKRHLSECSEKKHLSECSEKNIIPFSHLTLEYNAVSSKISPGLSIPWWIYIDSKKSNRPNLDRLLEGGKIYRIGVSFEDFSEHRPSWAKNFKNFKDNLLTQMLENGYELFEGEFCFGSKHYLINDKEYYAKLKFKTSKNKSKQNRLTHKVELKLEKTRFDGTRINRKPFFYDDLNTLNEWFINIKKKYGGNKK